MEILNWDKIKDSRPRCYKVLLYQDNPDHMRVYRYIMRNHHFAPYYIRCWHVEYDFEGREVLQGSHKKHCHVLFNFPHARTPQAVCNALQLSPQFVWPMGYVLSTKNYQTNFVRPKYKDDLEHGFLYLLHLNKLNSTQYPIEWLKGSDELVRKARSYIAEWQSSQVSERQALIYLRHLLRRIDEPVTFMQLFDMLVDTPYYKALRSPLCEKLRDNHNAPYYIRTGYQSDPDEDRALALVQRSQIQRASGGEGYYCEGDVPF